MPVPEKLTNLRDALHNFPPSSGLVRSLPKATEHPSGLPWSKGDAPILICCAQRFKRWNVHTRTHRYSDCACLFGLCAKAHNCCRWGCLGRGLQKGLLTITLTSCSPREPRASSKFAQLVHLSLAVGRCRGTWQVVPKRWRLLILVSLHASL